MTQLRDYQKKIIDDTRKSIAQGHKRIIIQAHVGAGKTIIAAEISRLARVKLKRTLFIAPRRQLVYQAVEKFEKLGIHSGIIMAGEKRFNMPLTQIGSIDTLTTRINNGRMDHPEAALLMVDEAHAIFSPSRLKFLSNYPLVIGITATPALANGKGMGAFYTDIVQGPTMSELVNQGYLVPMRYYGADYPDISKVTLNADGDYAENSLAEASDKPELIGCVYKNYKRLAGDRTTLIFAVNCKHGRHIYEEFKKHGVAVEYIDANTGTEERQDMEKRVDLGITKVIVNIGVMSFGTDWPRISCIIVARVTRNIAAWIQMVGRGSRLYPDKDDCIVVYHGHNFDELGPIDAEIEWSLDDKTTIRERKEIAQKERKEPKNITCKSCGYVFQSRKVCPSCHTEMIAPTESIPYHEADLVELKKTEKFTSEYKESWYQQMLGYCRRKGKKDGYAFYAYKDKFGVEPKWKKVAVEPSKEIYGWMQHKAIARSKAVA